MLSIESFRGSAGRFASFKTSTERVGKNDLRGENELIGLILEHVTGEAEKATEGILETLKQQWKSSNTNLTQEKFRLVKSARRSLGNIVTDLF